MRERSSLDSKDHISIYQVVTAIRDKKGNDFKEDNIGSFSCFYRQGSAKVPRGLAGFSKTLADQDEGTPKIVRRSKFGILRDRARRARMPRSRSQDVQSVPAGGVQIQHWTVPTSPRKKPSSKSIVGHLMEILTNKIQADRQRVIHLEANKRIGSKDERKQRRDCKAEFLALSVAAAALPCKCTLDEKYTEKKVCSLSILSPTDSSSPSSMTSRGSTTPRSPTTTTPSSTTA